MLFTARRQAICLLILFSCAVSQSCTATVPTQQQAGAPMDSAAVAARLQQIAAAGRLSELHWPDFSDYRAHFQRVYQPSNFSLLWTTSGQPTPQALIVMQALANSAQKGLIPDDYDASLWQGRVAALESAPASANSLADFDAALTVSTMRYISDLHIGRVNPRHFKFDIDVEQKKYDLPQFLLQKVVHTQDVQAGLDEVEPPYSGYKRTEVALQHYLQLAAQGDGPLVPDVQKAIAPNNPYSGDSELSQRLRLLGDLPASAAAPVAGTYGGELVPAVRLFQDRHGLTPDGNLTKDTIRQLNIPLAVRVHQLQDAMERWRWLPPAFPQPPVVANIPEFVLRAFSADHKIALRMNVVVGKAVRNQTPVFAKDMKYIVFRPYWNVPPSIVRGEIVPAIAKNRNYIANKNFEVTDQSGKFITSGPISDEVLAQLRAGRLAVRQKPGPSNALGLVKFIFPNTNNVYMHDTPSAQFFSPSRRDFSHGCIRLQRPADLAAYLLRNQPPWTPEKVKAAMQSGPDNQQVNLASPVPVLILYITAVVEEDGSVHFFDDIYGHDKSLEAVLAKGEPYPG
jgi:murein L,D-transpeptidase YcbB/YkuD